MAEITNRDRANWALTGVRAYWIVKASNPAEDMQTKAKDLVGDIIHLLRLESDMDFNEAASVINSAIEMARVETLEDRDY